MDYLSDDRMPVENITVEARVYVPEWKTGKAIGWTHGTVIAVQVPRPTPGVAPGEFDTSYIVRLDNGREQGYFAWSIGNPLPTASGIDV